MTTKSQKSFWPKRWVRSFAGAALATAVVGGAVWAADPPFEIFPPLPKEAPKDAPKDAPKPLEPKPPAMSFLGGAGAAFAAVPEGKVYSVALGQCLDVNAKERDGKPPPHAAPTKYRVAGEAWKAIYAPPATASVSAQVEDKRR